MTRLSLALIAALVTIGPAACSSAAPASVPARTPTPAAMDAMSGTMSTASSAELAPAVRGFYQGGEVTFIHTEASDPQVAGMLSRMMGPRVETVTQLSTVPEASVGNVFVFTNGVSGGGPFGFQEDVFDSVPGDAGYSPLRAINLVEWSSQALPRVLRSIGEIRDAEVKGELAIKRSGVVVNMPILSWPGGHR